jgi:epoxide hydrolase-like predicted phosphatase
MIEQSPGALIVDWGGVLTAPLATAKEAWFAAEGIDAQTYDLAMRDFRDEELTVLSTFDPVAALERGELKVEHFEQELAARIRHYGGIAVTADGMIDRMFSYFAAMPAMINVVRRARALGLKTALLSNSWGNEYRREDWDILFDAVVISGEVGMRKPEPGIFRHALELLDSAAGGAVFVDDLEANVRGAVAIGMIGVHHRSYAATLLELEAIFGLDLS